MYVHVCVLRVHAGRRKTCAREDAHAKLLGEQAARATRMGRRAGRSA